MGAWVIGHNLVGYLPEADTSAYRSWADAYTAYVDMAREYADTDDDHTGEWLDATADPCDYPGRESSGYGDDTPAMRAVVEAVLRDDPPAEDTGHGMWAEDGQGRRIAFWLTYSPTEPDPDQPDPTGEAASLASN